MCFQATLRSLWRSFFANAGAASEKKLPSRCKLALLERATKPVLSFRVTRWPFLVTRARQLDTIQRKMLGILLDLHPGPDQSAVDFIRHRAREAGRLQRQCGSWSKLWAASVMSWNDHLQREHNNATWPAQLSRLRTPQELQVRRLQLGGRPQTRAQSGWIKIRWFESIQAAQQHLQGMNA